MVANMVSPTWGLTRVPPGGNDLGRSRVETVIEVEVRVSWQ